MTSIHSIRTFRRALGAAALALLTAPAFAATPEWVERSDRNAQVLLDVLARQSPEGAGQLGIPGLDAEIFDLKPGFVERGREATRKAVAELQGRLAQEKDPAVRQDLQILIRSAEDNLRGGLAELFKKYQIVGYEEPYGKLKEQLAAYDEFVRREILPHARTDFRLPPELYAYSLEQVGVDMPVEELVSRAEVSFKELQNQMQALAPLVAKQHGIQATDYRDVLRELKKKQLTGEAILPHYQERIKALEEIIRREKIVSLPERPMRIRLASEAESVATPAPNMRPPRLIGNTGEIGEFVLPLRIPGQKGSNALALDDFTYEALSWTLTAHEGRPGHELQFASLVEKGVSKARAIFAFNSANVEGWTLYAEAEVQPYLPLEG